MRLKLVAIWRIITSQHYFLCTGSGSIIAFYPKEPKNFNLCCEMATKIDRMVNDEAQRGGREGK